MAYDLHWLVANRVLLITLRGDMLSDEFRAMDADLIARCAGTRTTTVHLLADLLALDSLPALFMLREMQISYQPNLGWAVGYGTRNNLVRTLLAASAALAGTRMRLFKTQGEALRFLNSIDRTLPPLETTADR
ncbi:MAG: hypothetical protein MUE40_21120 [Anaerolineae bacterium]|jgi:hypothetical protein|nr:hypothetical protein [Anaerolineae bacterium]